LLAAKLAAPRDRPRFAHDGIPVSTTPQSVPIDVSASLAEQLESLIDGLPVDSLALGVLLDAVGDEGLLLLCLLLVLVFLIPVSIPGVSTVFGAAIVLVGLSRLSGRPLWIPARLKHRQLPAERVRAGLTAGLVWVHRLERISRPHRLAGIAEGRGMHLLNNLAFISAALLLMVPFGFVPFSNTLPALALLFYAVGLIQRDGLALLIGHVAQAATVIYFGALIGAGGFALGQVWEKLGG
jgi:hypothetical protein